MNKHAPGRSSTKAFAQIPKAIMEALDDRRVSCVARAILYMLLHLFNGYNNGAIGFGTRRAAEILGVHATTISRGIKELADKGLIAATFVSSFHLKNRHLASEYRLTWLPTKTGAAPTFWTTPYVALPKIKHGCATSTAHGSTVASRAPSP